ncbi:NAD(P)-dependent dehydrogenase (short-subunit alcohol dehydrogenase family) [Rhodothalassium salexigens DSM 2132]|uniref:NAD(P)-dependent dehydrogenase (Short-subunit alcohol dehydrogenase family) n=1 Tax=Rhodothalassium salexigens DSM 2132 TaxID=1188247 RepID=A0A4V6NQS0_RHOSA|nr:SDR family oxidoreductase [Rhodothalassium salexigens]MBB4212283.1 3-oxoacyl-[acyl-carrier protein] reductase [Rhodothalassium salexigens DSM 2132]MBK1638359.1 hypothetical protein [Rhodothalassium salexigens DSM 2132]TCP32566.1 NAD(P)-dependent dehydrogenase (short-subunit alcohol dehydrogenase family) [Rhodothalassium salexigens DSM 2132]
MDLGLSGLRAAVTGATRGIGRATADLLAEEGADVAICARRADAVAETVEALEARGVQAMGETVDLARPGVALKRWIDRAAERFGGLDIVVINVSGGGGMTDEIGWRTNFEVDLMGAVRTAEAALPHLARSHNGAMVMVASIAAVEDFGGVQAYNSMKAALINYAANQSQALADQGIRVNSVSPGVTLCPGGVWDQVRQQMPDQFQATAARVPLGQRFARPTEIARTIAFLASPASCYTTGTNVVVDGGLTRRVQY